ncbi:MAG: prohibitin family protein [Flavobacteriaceae bacterium]|jgi:regulator of protease activity HflC (stomatin/prohibitin superfamily)|nr:prohibitin family protein [Flavobacteriaceae bacterium]
MNNNQLNFPKLGLPIIFAIIIAIIFFSKSFVTVDAGEAGVLWKRFAGGVVVDQPALGEGFHVVAPWNKVYIYEVRQQELFEKMKVLSKNGLEIQIDASAWYEPVYKDLGNLHQSLGENYLDRVIKPAIRSAARSVVGRYLPDELYSTKRDAIQVEIFEETKKILEKQYVQLNEILVRDVTLPNTIKDAIERKLKQEQESLEYEFRLVTAAKEAEKVIIEAQGKADANRILSASLTDKILKDKGIEATLELAKSQNSKVVVIGSGKDGMPLILGGNQ